MTKRGMVAMPLRATTALTSLAARGSIATFALTVLASAALAQEAKPVAQADDPQALGQNEVELESGQSATGDDTIVVTGSRINRPNLGSVVPITSVGVQELTATGDLSIGDALNELPALRATVGQRNSGLDEGSAGLNILDLRGLGPQRTLVLVNGRRHIAGQVTRLGAGSVDVNTIPTALIDRVDVVTGGNSAIYGSDAVAGVVNFILKRDFEGIRVLGQGGVSSREDRGTYFLSLTGGENFAEGRGNVAVNLEYSKQNSVSFSQRDDQVGGATGFTNWSPLYPGIFLDPPGGDGIPDLVLVSGLRRFDFAPGGMIQSVCPRAPAAGTDPAAAAEINRLRTANCTGEIDFQGNPLGNTYYFDGGGNLLRNPILGDLRKWGAFSVVGGMGSTLNEANILLPENERMSANLLAHFDVSDGFQPFVEAKFVRVNAETASTPTSGSPYVLSVNNPFLTAQARARLLEILPAGQQTFNIGRWNLDFGARGENNRRDTYRAVAGVNGSFNDDWRYEVALNYGRLETSYSTVGNTIPARLTRSINAVTNSQGQIVCSVNADANSANDDPACVPVNLFGQGSVSAAALDYFGYTTKRRQTAQQYNAIGYVSGDSSQLLELPGGPIAFAIGAEFRRETAFSTFDPFTLTGATFLGTRTTFDPPALEVKEAFGELRVPLLKDAPLAHELSLEAAGRFSDYNVGSTGTVFAYNVGGTWAPVEDLRLRVGYARSVRAPNLVDLFLTNENVNRSINDPCSAENIKINANRVANCAALGVPTTMISPTGATIPYSNLSNTTIAGTSRGNADLEEERSSSFTVGAVLQPRFLPGFSLSVDYYDIKVRNVIQALGAQAIVDQCVDSPSGIDNPYCAAVFRNPDGTFRGQTGRLVAGIPVSLPATTGPAFFEQPFNFARLETSGIDVDAAYRTSLGGNTTLNLRALVSYLINRDTFTDIRQPDFRVRVKSLLGDPQWEANLSATLDFGLIDANYNMRFVGRQLTTAQYNSVFPIDGRPAQNPDMFEFNWLPHITYHNLRLGIEPNEKFRFYAGVDNVFDQDPPGGLDSTTRGGGIWDFAGRYFYAGVDVRF